MYHQEHTFEFFAIVMQNCLTQPQTFAGCRTKDVSLSQFQNLGLDQRIFDKPTCNSVPAIIRTDDVKTPFP